MARPELIRHHALYYPLDISWMWIAGTIVYRKLIDGIIRCMARLGEATQISPSS